MDPAMSQPLVTLLISGFLLVIASILSDGFFYRWIRIIGGLVGFAIIGAGLLFF